MASRNRTKEYKELRKKRGGNLSIILPVGIPPEWVGHIESIHNIMNTIKEKMEVLKEAHNKHILPRFEDNVGEEQKIEILTQEITGLFQEARKKIKALHSEKGQKKLENNLRSTLAQELQELSIIFRKYQKDFLNKLQARQQKKHEYSLDIMNEEGDENFTVEMSFTQAQKKSLLNTEETVAQREKEIKEIVKSVKELAQIFNDLSVLVYEQGTIIDRIDYNLEVVEEHVETGVSELREARSSQKKYTNRLCILLICLVLVMGLIVLIKAIFFGK